MALVSSKKCKLCGNENGHFFCYDCKHVLCQECRFKHDRIPALKTHTITASDVIDRSAYTSKSECDIHDQECSLYCSTCQTLTCTQCVTSNHKNHSFVDISAVASEARKSTEDYISKIKEKISNLSEMITKVKSYHMKKLGEEAEQVLFTINCSSQDLQKIIESQADISKINVEDWRNLEKADVEVHLRGLEQMYKVHSKLCDELENMLHEKHDKSFFLYFKNLKSDCENLEEIPEEIDFKHIEEFDTNAFVHHVTAMIVKTFSISDYGRTDELQDQIKDQKLELLTLHERSNTRIESLEEEHIILRQKFEQSLKRIKTVDDENTMLKRHKEMTEQSIIKVETENTTLMRELQRSNTRIASLEKEMSNSKQNIEHSAKKIKAVTEENKTVKQKLEMSEKRIKTVEEENSMVKEQLELSNTRNESLENENKIAKKNIELSEKRIKSVTEENLTIKQKPKISEMQKLRMQLASASSVTPDALKSEKRIKSVTEETPTVKQRPKISEMQKLRIQLASASSVTPDALNTEQGIKSVTEENPKVKQKPEIGSTNSVTLGALNVPTRLMSPAAESSSAGPIRPYDNSYSTRPRVPDALSGSALARTPDLRCMECSHPELKRKLYDKERVFRFCQTCRKQTDHREYILACLIV